MTSGETQPKDAPIVHEGDLLVDKYRVGQIIGRGGMGVVIAARHVQLDEPVAIKLLLPSALANPEAVARFLREAKAAVKIKSPHVARVFDVGTLPTGVPFLVMEYLEGKDLGGWLAENGVMSTEMAVDLVLQACEAVAEAHSLGIIHRDLKPSNLFASRGPDGLPMVKVLDFGISKLIGENLSRNDAAQTGTKAILGSPLYMSPEQLRSSRDVDQRTDIWSFGAILYELLTGQPPFQAETFPELFFQILNVEPKSLRLLRPEVPPGLMTVVVRCLSKDSSRRYHDVALLAEALQPFGSKHSALVAERIARIVKASQQGASRPPTSPGKGVLEQTLTAWGQSWAGSSRGKNRLIAATAGLLVVASCMGFLAWRARSTTSDHPVLITTDAGVAAPASNASPHPSANHAVTELTQPQPQPVSRTTPDLITQPSATTVSSTSPTHQLNRARAIVRSPRAALSAVAPSAPLTPVRVPNQPLDPFADQH